MEQTPLDLTTSLHDISVTERGAFRTCRRRWHLEVIENLVPKQPMWALAFGTGIHAALETYYLGSFSGNEPSIDDALDSFDLWYQDTETAARKDLGSLWAPEVGEELSELRLMGETMLGNYPQFEEASKTVWSNVLAVEGRGMEEFENKRPRGYPKEADVIVHESGRCMVPIVDPYTKRPIERDGQPVYLTARLDLLVERPRPFTGIWIVDHKTSASQPSNRGLDFDDQATGYCYVVWRLTGKMPRGAIYNYLIKNTPKPPRYNKTKTNGSFLSAAKDQLTIPNDYRDALKEEGLYRAGKVTSDKHADCLAGLLARGWDPFYQRFEPRRNAAEIESFESRLFNEYEDMVTVFENENKQYPNLSTWWCPSCSVAPICQAMEDDSDWEDVIESRFMEGEDRKAQ